MSGDAGHSASLCIVLLAESEPHIDRGRLDEAIRLEFGVGLDSPQGEDPSDIFAVTVGEASIFMAPIAAPVPDNEAEHHADGNYLWPNGRAEAAAHRSHIVVALTNSSLGAIDAALQVTRATRILVEQTNALGVYWGSGSVTNRADVFAALSDNMGVDLLPLNLWVRFQHYQETADAIGLYTLGMSQFGANEIEMTPSSWTPQRSADFAYDIAHYLLTSGATIRDGDTIGASDDERIRVRYKPSTLDATMTAYELEVS